MNMLKLFLFCLFWLPCLGIEVTRGTPCAPRCNGGGATLNNNIVCKDRNYNATQVGRTMKNCLLCESNNTAYKTPTDNNLYWFLFNQQRILQRCLYQLPGKVSAFPDCRSNCSAIRGTIALNWNVSDHEGIGQYDYCDWKNGTFSRNVAECSSCLGEVEDSVYLSTFLNNLESACQTKPNASRNETLQLSRPLFYTPWPINVTDTDSGSNSDSGLSTGAKVGIGVGVAAGAILIAVIAWLLMRRRSKKKRVVSANGSAPMEGRQKRPTELESAANYLELPGNTVPPSPIKSEEKPREIRAAQMPAQELPAN